MRSIRPVSMLLVFALATPAFPAFADDAASAEALFKEGKTLMDKGKFAEACPKLEASLAYDRTAGGTILRLAACYQGLKKWASAWGKYSDALQRAKLQGRKDRIDAATKGITAVEVHMSRLAIRVDPAAKVTGLELKLDDVAIPEGAWGTATPIDPGTHTIAANAPGYTAWQTTITIALTVENKSVDVPKLTAIPTPVAATAPVAPPKPTTTAASSSGDVGPTSKVTPTNTQLYVGIGVGVLLLGAGLGSYLKARSERDQYFDDCKQQPAVTCDDPAGRTRVRTWETIAFAAGGVGLAAVGVGVTLLVTSKPNEKKPAGARIVASPTVAQTGGGLTVVGEF